jgi:hypothetical protein
MTPKEKAKQLYIDMLSWQDNSIEYLERNIISISAKKCAVIAVGEIIDLVKHIDVDSEDYWNEVKQEIEKL